MAKAFAITFALLFGFVAFIFYRTGYYKEVNISSGYQGPFIMAYKVHKGPYHKIAEVIDGVESFFKKNQLSCPMAFGRYLHDPNLVEHDRLESHGGCLFLSPSQELKALAKKGQLILEEIKKKEYLVASFDGSPSIGPFKVYPEVENWLNKYGYKKNGPVIEIYQTTGVDSITTRYLFSYQ